MCCMPNKSSFLKYVSFFRLNLENMCTVHWWLSQFTSAPLFYVVMNGQEFKPVHSWFAAEIWWAYRWVCECTGLGYMMSALYSFLCMQGLRHYCCSSVFVRWGQGNEEHSVLLQIHKSSQRKRRKKENSSPKFQYIESTLQHTELVPHILLRSVF